jgi:hypothetical protein
MILEENDSQSPLLDRRQHCEFRTWSFEKKSLILILYYYNILQIHEVYRIHMPLTDLLMNVGQLLYKATVVV